MTVPLRNLKELGMPVSIDALIGRLESDQALHR